MFSVSTYVGESGAIRAFSHASTVIVVDVLRSCSTIVCASNLGIKKIYPIKSIGDAKTCFVIGESGGKKISGATIGNSPLELINFPKLPNEISIISSNGTRCFLACKNNKSTVLAGCILNLSETVRYACISAERQDRNIAIVLAGCQGILEKDDKYVADLLCKKIFQYPNINFSFVDNCSTELLKTEAGIRLSNLGAREDVSFCAKIDSIPIVVRYDVTENYLFPVFS